MLSWHPIIDLDPANDEPVLLINNKVSDSKPWLGLYSKRATHYAEFNRPCHRKPCITCRYYENMGDFPCSMCGPDHSNWKPQ